MQEKVGGARAGQFNLALADIIVANTDFDIFVNQPRPAVLWVARLDFGVPSRPALASNDPISMTNPAPSGATPAPADAAKTPAPTPAGGTPVVPPRRGPGHRGQDVRDAVAEMAARAHEISLEAGSKMASAMKDVINAAAGLTAFAIESARELVQYMVRRGQMTQDEADKLMRDVEATHGRSDSKAKAKSSLPAAPKPEKAAKPVVVKAVAAPAAPKAKAKPVAKVAAKPAAKKNNKKR